MSTITIPQIKNIARRLLNLKKTVPFQIVDYDDDYAMLRQEGTYGSPENQLRGTIIDYRNETIVCGQSDFIVECTQSLLAPLHGDDIIVTPDSTKKPIVLPLADVQLRYGIEGTNLLVWMDKYGRIRLSSHRKLDCDEARSSYASSQPYVEYLKMNGIDMKKFYREGVLSRVVHRLIVQYPDLAPCCRRNSEGNICYDGYFVENARVFPPGVTVDSEAKLPNEIFDHITSSLSEVVMATTPTVFIATNEISLGEANNFLALGYYPATPSIYRREMCTLPGEFVYVSHLTTRNTYRVKSVGWKWRFYHIYEANVIQNAYEAYSYAADAEAYKTAGFPTMHYQNDAVLYRMVLDGIPIIEFSTLGPTIDVSTYRGRLYNIMLSLLLITRVAKQSQVLMALSQYVSSFVFIAKELLSIIKESAPEKKRSLYYALQSKANNIISQLPEYCHTEVEVADHLRKLPGSQVYTLVRDFTKFRATSPKDDSPTEDTTQ